MDLAERLQNLVESQQAARAALERQAAQLERALEEAERRAIAAEGALGESREEQSRRAEAQGELERRLVELSGAVDQRDGEIARQRAELDGVAAQVEELRSTQAAATSELQSTREEADRLRAEAEQAQTAAAAAREEIGPAVESRVEDLRAEAEEARAEIEQERARTAEQTQQSHAQWEAALEQTRVEGQTALEQARTEGQAALEQARTEAQAAVAEKQAELERVRAEGSARADSEVEAARGEIRQSVETELQQAQAAMQADAAAQVEQARAEASKQLADARTELSRLKADAEEAHRKYAELERAHTALQQAQGGYERQIAEAQGEVEREHQARVDSESAAKEAAKNRDAESDQALAEAADHLAGERTAAFEALKLDDSGDAAGEQPAPPTEAARRWQPAAPEAGEADEPRPVPENENENEGEAEDAEPEGPLDGVAKAQLGWSTRRLVRRQLDRIAERLEPDEPAQYMATGVYERTPTLVVATDRRVILAGERDDQLSAISYANVREVREGASGRRWFARPRLEITTDQGQVMVEDVTENVKALTQHIASNSPHALVAPSDGADG